LKRTILVDLDDTLAPVNHKMLDLLNEQLGTDYSINDLESYDYFESMPEDHAEYMMSLWNRDDLYQHINVEPEPYAIGTLKKLRSDYEIYIVSKPLPGHATSKMQWLEEIDEDAYDGYILTEHKHQVKGDIIIDDSPEHLYEAPQSMFKIIYDRPYNRDLDDIGVARAHSWKDVLHRIENIFAEATA
jgi:5'(3')-deoxyribonucleotidase